MSRTFMDQLYHQRGESGRLLPLRAQASSIFFVPIFVDDEKDDGNIQDGDDPKRERGGKVQLIELIENKNSEDDGGCRVRPKLPMPKSRK